MRSPALVSPGSGQFCAVSTWQPGLAQLGSLRHNLQEPKAVSGDLGLHGVCLLTHRVFPRASAAPMVHSVLFFLPPCCRDRGTCYLPGLRFTLGAPLCPCLPPSFGHMVSPVWDSLSQSLGRIKLHDCQVHFSVLSKPFRSGQE